MYFYNQKRKHSSLNKKTPSFIMDKQFLSINSTNIFFKKTVLDAQCSSLFYLAMKKNPKKWSMPIKNWKQALNQFSIIFVERFPKKILTLKYKL